MYDLIVTVSKAFNLQNFQIGTNTVFSADEYKYLTNPAQLNTTSEFNNLGNFLLSQYNLSSSLLIAIIYTPPLQYSPVSLTPLWNVKLKEIKKGFSDF